MAHTDYTMKATLQRRHARQNASGFAPVQLRITISGVRSDLATGIFCPAAYWSEAAHKLIFPARPADQVPELPAELVDQYNADLADFRRQASDTYWRLRKPNPKGPAVPVTVAQVRAELRRVDEPEPEAPAARQLLEIASAYLAAVRAAPPESRHTDSTIKTFVTRYNTLALYLEKQRQAELAAAEVDVPWARRYERWLLTDEGNHGVGAMRKQIGFVQQALGFAVEEGWLRERRLHGYKFQARAVPKVPAALPATEVGRLVAVLPELDLPSRRVVSGWLFCAYTGLSWVDYRRFCATPADFLHMEAAATAGQPRQCWLRMVRQKMKRRKPAGFSVPLFTEAADLLLAWRGRLPHTNDVNANKILHRVEAELQLSESLTTKLARATFSQLKRDEGYSDEVVAAMMGDTVTVMNQHYSRISERRTALEMSQVATRRAMAVAA